MFREFVKVEPYFSNSVVFTVSYVNGVLEEANPLWSIKSGIFEATVLEAWRVITDDGFHTSTRVHDEDSVVSGIGDDQLFFGSIVVNVNFAREQEYVLRYWQQMLSQFHRNRVARNFVVEVTEANFRVQKQFFSVTFAGEHEQELSFWT